MSSQDQPFLWFTTVMPAWRFFSFWHLKNNKTFISIIYGSVTCNHVILDLIKQKSTLWNNPQGKMLHLDADFTMRILKNEINSKSQYRIHYWKMVDYLFAVKHMLRNHFCFFRGGGGGGGNLGVVISIIYEKKW